MAANGWKYFWVLNIILVSGFVYKKPLSSSVVLPSQNHSPGQIFPTKISIPFSSICDSRAVRAYFVIMAVTRSQVCRQPTVEMQHIQALELEGDGSIPQFDFSQWVWEEPQCEQWPEPEQQQPDQQQPEQQQPEQQQPEQQQPEQKLLQQTTDCKTEQEVKEPISDPSTASIWQHSAQSQTWNQTPRDESDLASQSGEIPIANGTEDYFTGTTEDCLSSSKRKHLAIKEDTSEVTETFGKTIPTFVKYTPD